MDVFQAHNDLLPVVSSRLLAQATLLLNLAEQVATLHIVHYIVQPQLRLERVMHAQQERVLDVGLNGEDLALLQSRRLQLRRHYLALVVDLHGIERVLVCRVAHQEHCTVCAATY